MKAVYTCVAMSGEKLTVIASTESTIEAIKKKAELKHGQQIQDVVDELRVDKTRAGYEDLSEEEVEEESDVEDVEEEAEEVEVGAETEEVEVSADIQKPLELSEPTPEPEVPAQQPTRPRRRRPVVAISNPKPEPIELVEQLQAQVEKQLQTPVEEFEEFEFEVVGAL